MENNYHFKGVIKRVEYLQEITLDVNSNTAYTTVGAKQGDNLSRVIKVHLTENGRDKQIEAGTSAYFRFRKPDGKAIVNIATIEDNAIYIVLTSQTLSAPGRGYADITLQSGTTILSSVSFILIIMAAPQVVEQITSSNEFGYLNAVVSDAVTVINEAEAWAKGTRGGAPVVSSDKFEATEDSSVIDGIEVNESTFMSKVGSNPGLSRTYTFTFTENLNWRLKSRVVNGSSITESDPELINNLADYGIALSLIGGVSTPNPGDSIIVLVEEPDNTYQNNSKYYAEQAASHEQKIANLTVSAESSVNPGVVKEEHEQHDGYNLHFYLPKGDTGDVNLMTFYVDTDTESDTYGCIISCKPESMAVASIESYPEQLILKFDKATFQQQVRNNYRTYNFIYNANGSFWHLGNNTSINLSDYGISYTLNGYRLQNNDTITIKYYEQVKFSINDNGELEVEIMEG